MFVAGDEGVLDAGEDPDFVESVLLLAVGQILNFNFLKGVLTAILKSLYFVNTGVRSIA